MALGHGALLTLTYRHKAIGHPAQLLPALWPYGEGVGIEDRARGPSLESLSNPLLD